MKLSRRRCLDLVAGVAALPALSRMARAQSYPVRSVRIIVTVAPGGGADITARLIAQWLSERLGQQVIVENRSGGSGNIATEAVVRALADGHTLLAVAVANPVNGTLFDKLNFNFLRDIAPVSGTIRVANVAHVHPSVPVKTIPELIAYAKANPGKINMASAGNETSSHVAGELFKMMTTARSGVEAQWRHATRPVPLPSQTPACRGLATDRLAGSGQARSRPGRG